MVAREPRIVSHLGPALLAVFFAFTGVAAQEAPEYKVLKPIRGLLYCHVIAFSPNGKIVAVGTDVYGPGLDEKAIILWEVESGKELHHIIVPKTVSHLAFSPDSKLLAAGEGERFSEGPDKQCIIRVWDVASGERRLTLEGHKAGVTGVGFLAGGKTLVSGSWDGSIRLWDLATGKEAATLLACHSQSDVDLALRGIRSLAVSPDGNFAAVGQKFSVHLWDLRQRKKVTTLQSGGAGILSMTYSVDGALLAVCHMGSFHLWDVTTGEELYQLPGVRDVSFSSDGKLLATQSPGESVKIRDAASGKELVELRTKIPHTDAGFSNLRFIEWVKGPPAFSPVGTRMATWSTAGLVIWDSSRWKPE